MSAKVMSCIKLSDTLTISECKDGFWLYDYTQGMNLAMRAETERDALVQAIMYYQKSSIKNNGEYKKLQNAIDVFISSVTTEDE